MRAPRNPRREAEEVLGGLPARVLEPSPPAVPEGPFFADDPVAIDPGEQVVTPSAGTRTWDALARERPEIAAFARANWLGNRKPLPPLPVGYVAAREAYHRLAYGVVAEARRLANTKFGLRYTKGGFGTPFFGRDEQVRVEGASLIHQRGDSVESSPITSLAEAGAFLRIEPGTAAAEHDSPPLGDLHESLPVDAATGDFLGDWFGFAFAVLEELRLTSGAVDAERPQLWPGHFDPAMAMGDGERGGRATYGLSPGDASSTTPYLYVGAWGEVDTSDPFWSAGAFNGASMSYAELTSAPDAFATALEFFRTGHTKLRTE